VRKFSETTDGNGDEEDGEDGFGDFDDFEEGEEGAEFGDFDDGFPESESHSVIYPPQPITPIPSFVSKYHMHIQAHF
jgi:hypothetical protein